jgi:hypothetical protein
VDMGRQILMGTRCGEPLQAVAANLVEDLGCGFGQYLVSDPGFGVGVLSGAVGALRFSVAAHVRCAVAA